MADDYTATDEQQALAPIAPPPPMPTSAYEVEKPNPLLGFLVGVLTGSDILGQKHDAEQRAANAQFWKQTEFAKWQLSHREDLANDYDGISKDFYTQNNALQKARVELAVQKSFKAPPEMIAPLEENVRSLTQITEYLRGSALSRQQQIDKIDGTMGPMIAHMTPPQGLLGGGQGGAGATPSTPPSSEQMQGQQATATMTPQQIAQTPVEHWKEALEDSGLGFPKTRADGSPNGVVVGNRIQYFAETTQQAKDMQDQLDSFQKLPQFGGLRAPVTVIDMEKAGEHIADETHKSNAEIRALMGKAAQYKALQQINPDTASLQRMLDAANQRGDNEFAGNLSVLIAADEKKRVGLYQKMVDQFDAEAATPRRRVAGLQPGVEKYDAQQLRNMGIDIVAESAVRGTATPGMSDSEFRDYYIAKKNADIKKNPSAYLQQGMPGAPLWDKNKPQEWQIQELQEALKKYRAGQ